jgi:hypothetical protein
MADEYMHYGHYTDQKTAPEQRYLEKGIFHVLLLAVITTNQRMYHFRKLYW